jgi:phenylacetate-CoA oxygenase PaaI subunit
MSVAGEKMRSWQHVDELDPQVAEAVLRWTLSLADTKHRIGMRTSEWINGTPALEGAVGAAAITQDELGHARSYYSMLRDFPGAPDTIGFENDLEARDDYYNPRILNEPWDSWLDVIAVNVLLDRALSIAVEATGSSAFAPLKQRTAKILQEESYHRLFGDSWLTRLAQGDEGTRRRMQESLDRFWETTLTWLGPDKDPATGRLNEAGVLNTTPNEMRGRWLDEVSVLLEARGLEAPAGRPDWSRWNGRYRDIPG